MLVLFQPPGAWGTPSVSPFCIKLQCYLRMAGVPYEVRAPNMAKAPKGKVPYVLLDGELVGDSQLVLERLEARSARPLDAHLTPEAHAKGHAVRRMLEEATYFTSVYLRWGTDDGYAVVKQAFLSFLPKGIGAALLPLVRRKVRGALRAQGTGRHSPGEITAMGIADWTAVAALLGDGPYLLGEKPTTFDATVFAFLWALTGFPVSTPLREFVLAERRLQAYFGRMKALCFAGVDTNVA